MQRRWTVALAVLALVASACGGDGNDSNNVSAKKKTTTTLSLDDATTTTGAGLATSTSSASTVKGAGSATTAKSTATTQATASSPTTDPNAAPGPAQTGTYDYAQSGSTSQGSVPPSGTLVVTGSGPSQTFTRRIDANNSADLYYVFRSDGPFINRVVLHQGPATINCTFAAPVAAPPWPPATGRTFSGHATCGSGFTADFSGSITGQRTDDVGGKIVDVVVIASTLRVVGNGIDITVKDTQYWAPSLRVPTYSNEVFSGTAFNQPVSGEVTSNLKSTTPR